MLRNVSNLLMCSTKRDYIHYASQPVAIPIHTWIFQTMWAFWWFLVNLSDIFGKQRNPRSKATSAVDNSLQTANFQDLSKRNGIIELMVVAPTQLIKCISDQDWSDRDDCYHEFGILQSQIMLKVSLAHEASSVIRGRLELDETMRFLSIVFVPRNNRLYASAISVDSIWSKQSQDYSAAQWTLGQSAML
jgi:hypothetical protein